VRGRGDGPSNRGLPFTLPVSLPGADLVDVDLGVGGSGFALDPVSSFAMRPMSMATAGQGGQTEREDRDEGKHLDGGFPC
jgi:hypothetical protein